MKTKLTDLLISAIIKRGIVWEARNLTADVEIPDSNIVVRVKIENMQARFETKNEEES